MREVAVGWGHRVRDGRLHVCQFFSKFHWPTKDFMIKKHFRFMKDDHCAYHRVVYEYYNTEEEDKKSK